MKYFTHILQNIFYPLLYLFKQIFRSPLRDFLLPFPESLLFDLPGTWGLGLEYLSHFAKVELVINVDVDMGPSSSWRRSGGPRRGLGPLGSGH